MLSVSSSGTGSEGLLLLPMLSVCIGGEAVAGERLHDPSACPFFRLILVSVLVSSTDTFCDDVGDECEG